ncbi:MAG TPA: glycosyltransferase [Candidatus Angelobacter sp.]|nr:glycosyltransferase [Candidatus Angelobacter sp.]
MKNKEYIEKFRTASPSDLIQEYGGGKYFDEAGTPVIIPARNEEKDIAATLASLAENNRLDGALVHPIVVENGSEDKTSEIAKAMGATVLHSKEAFKLAALQEGVGFLKKEELLDKPVLFTDADSIVSPTWVNALSNAVRGEKLAFASGKSTLAYGPSAVSDLVGNLVLRLEDWTRQRTGDAPVGRGDNMALNFANDQETIDWYLNQDKRLFVYEDDALSKEFEKRDARMVRLLGHEAIVSSLGDRYDSIWKRLRILGPNADQWLFSEYEKKYPGIVFGKYKKH